MEIGKQIKKYRKEMELSQDELAEKIFVSRQTISNWENNKNYPDIKSLLTILLPIPLMKFMGRTGIIIFIAICIVEIYYAIRIEKYKKNFNIQTYKEIITFLEGKKINEVEKHQEYGKRPYQKIFLAISSALLAIIVSAIMMYLL